MSLIQKLKHNYLSRAAIVTMDLILSTLSSVLILFVVDIVLGHFQISPVSTPREKLSYIALALVASGIAFIAFRPYRIIIRRFSAKDLVVFAAATTLKGLIILAVIIGLGQYSGTYLLLVISDALITLAALISVRILMILV